MMMNWRGKNSKESEKGKKIAAKYMKKAVLCFVSSADFLLHRQLCCTVVLCPRQNSRVG